MCNRDATFAERFSMSKPFSSPSKMNCLRQLAIAGLILLPVVALPQSLWRDDSRSMFADKRATAIGDILTIVVQENTTASKDNKTATSKQAAVDAAINSFLF